MKVHELQYWRPDVVHELKTWPDPFRALRCGRKTFEFRRDDRGFAVGDVLVLQEWDPPSGGDELEDEEGYTGRSQRYLVTHITRGPDFGVPEGFVVMSLQSLAHLDRNCARVDCYECSLHVQDELAKRLKEAEALNEQLSDEILRLGKGMP